MAHNTHNLNLKLLKKLVVYQLVFVMLAGFLVPVNQSQAQTLDPLVISNITISKTDEKATISWRTNRAAFGRIDYGLFSNDYRWRVQTNQKKQNQAITISGLFPQTDYFFRITADDDVSEVRSVEQVFETNEKGDNKSPKISDVAVVYTTGSTATIQWFTDEDATSEVHYGLSENYGSVRSDGRRVKVHDLTLTGLVDGTFYHFRAQSKDKDNNTSRWFDMTFRTKLTNKTDNAELNIYNIEPVSENDIDVGQNTAVISWRTNKLAEGWVRYSTSPSPGATVATNPPRVFNHNVTLTGLKSNTTYYYDIQAKDVLGQQVRSEIFSFQTKPSSAETAQIDSQIDSSPGLILGAATCNVNLETDFGFYGAYYNHRESHPDMNIAAGSTWTKVGRENDWYDNQYFSFDRIDQVLNFDRFFPFENELPGDPYHFAVNWQAIVDVPQDGSYTYQIASDDDSWLIIDGQLMHDLGGLHRAALKNGSLSLTAGLHKLEIFYAERRTSGAQFIFNSDSRLTFHPLPLGCSIQDVLDYNSGSGGPTPTVLGVSTDDGFVAPPAPPQPTYVCNPDLGYAKIKALYKTTASPDVWAWLETGQKHYITSPESFNLYQCDWSQIKTVSQNFLDGFANATLVRTPTDPVIYHLFDRPVVKWLKINIPSPSIFVSYENNFWGNVARINHLDIASYPAVQLIKGKNDSTVYLIEDNTKRPFSPPSVFTSLGYDWIEVVTLNQPHLDSYLTGATID